MATLNMRMRALYASNYFTEGPPARRFDNPYFIPSTQVLLQQLVNKGKAVTPPAVATPPRRPSGAASSAAPAAPDVNTAGATGTAAPAAEERKPPSKMPTGGRGRDGRRGPGVAATSDTDAFGRKQGVSKPITDAKARANAEAIKIQNTFNRAVAAQLKAKLKEQSKSKPSKKAPSKAPTKAPPAAAAPAATPAPTSSPGPAVRDAVYTNLSPFDAASLRGQVRERTKQEAKYRAEGLKSSMLVKATNRKDRGNKFAAKMLKFRQNQGRINDKIRAANKKIQTFLNKAQADKSTSRRIRPSKKSGRDSLGP